MNTPPKTAKRVPAEKMREFVTAVFESVAMPTEKAKTMAELLVTNDLRGVFSHGTRQLAAYPRLMKDGKINPAPEVELVSETPTTVMYDGDGGLGYFPAQEAAHAVAKKGREQGIAVGVTRNHGHFGAAGLHSRVIVSYDLAAYVTSGHQLNLQPDQLVKSAAGGSPMSFALPTESEPPFVLDFGAMHDFYDSNPHWRAVLELAPGTVFRSIGLGAVCQALGGFLAGIPVDPKRAKRSFAGANQGSMLVAIDVSRFIPVDQFKREMSEFIEKAMAMKPMPGFDKARLPGGVEWEHEREYAQEGIPVGESHEEVLRSVGEEFGVKVPLD